MNRSAAATRRQGLALITTLFMHLNASRARIARVGFSATLAVLGLIGALGLTGAGVVPPVQAQGAASPDTVLGTGAIADVQARGIINPSLAHYVIRAIDRAEADGMTAVVIELDTPGGLDSSMRQIIQRILSSRVPVIVYVSPPGGRAGSAGVYITYAAHVAAMSPNTNIGSATPVAMGENGEQRMSAEMRAKVTNDAVAYVRSLAEQRGRNADWTEKAVRDGANITAQEALRTNVVDVVANDLADLVRQVDGRTVLTAAGEITLKTAGAPIQRVEMGWVDRILHIISDPTIAYILLSLGTMGLFLELSNPGSILPGVSGGICLLLGFYALGTLPVNFAGLALIGFAFILWAVDLFAPSHGILTVGGLVSFVFGSLMLFNVPEAAPWLGISLWTVFAVSAVMGGFFLVVGQLVARSLALKPSMGREALIGRMARAKTPLTPAGMVWLEGALWEATAVGGPAAGGQQVEVIGVAGLHLTVRSVQEGGVATKAESPTDAPTVQTGRTSAGSRS